MVIYLSVILDLKELFNFTCQPQEEAGSAGGQPASNKADTYTVRMSGLPGRVKRLDHHKYKIKDIEVLKLSALYGANGSGKSNLIRSISLLKAMLLKSSIPNTLNSQKFKLSESAAKEPVELAIEFFSNTSLYYYSVSIHEGAIIDEYFSTDAVNEEDEMIFHRKYNNKKTKKAHMAVNL